MRRFHPSFEQFEPKMLSTLVFLLSGNAFAESGPDILTLLAANQLIKHGDRPVRLTTPAMTSPSNFYQLAAEIRTMSMGQPIGLLGFSAGGALALRLSGLPGLNVTTVISYYGPPDLRDWLSYHRGDRYYHYVTSHVHFTSGIINLLSGPSSTKAYTISAFGLSDQNVVSTLGTASFNRDFPNGHVYYYPGRHGAAVRASLPAFEDFLSHL
jgi:hypothetical protein